MYGEELDLAIMQWVLEMRDLQLPISCEALRVHARKLVGDKAPDVAFQASRGWLQKFLRRHNFTLRMKTLFAQRLLSDLEERI